MRIALEGRRVIVTQDGDFHRMLANSGDNQPSVIRLRLQSLELPKEVGPLIAAAATQHQDALHAGAVVTVDESESRVRPLPLKGDKQTRD